MNSLRYLFHVSLKRIWPRVLAPLVLAASLACFSLPFLSLSVDARSAEATGLELVTGDVTYRGSYIHDAWRGELEGIVRDGHIWAVPAFGAILLACVLLLLPWRRAWWAAVVVAAVGLVLMLFVFQATSSVFHPPDPHRLYGYWLALGIVLLVFLPISVRLREPVGDPTLRRPPDWLTRSERRGV